MSKLVEKKDKAVAYGEVTGHSHRVIGDDAKVWADNPAAEWAKEITAKTEFRIVHEEHGAIEFTSDMVAASGGKIKVGKTLEFDPIKREQRYVWD